MKVLILRLLPGADKARLSAKRRLDVLRNLRGPRHPDSPRLDHYPRPHRVAPLLGQGLIGSLQLLAHDGIDLNRVDGLTFDRFGNLFAIATGFNKTAGLAFDPFNGDLYIAEQQSQNIWRLQFTPTAVPLPTGAWLLGLGLALLLRHRRN